MREHHTSWWHAINAVMGHFVVRRLLQSVLTIFGVMVLTFILFNYITKDISRNYLPRDPSQEVQDEWEARHGFDKPKFFNTKYPITQKGFWDCQFIHHMTNSITFRAESFKFKEPIYKIIYERAPYSLALTIPGLAFGWCLGMVLSLLVAYYRDTTIDRVGVFLAVIGMCMPFLAYMILGQWLVFRIAPDFAWGYADTHNLYIPIAISVIAGVGTSVRFYRTIFLDEVQKDYVRTARAKGTSLGRVLFVHVLKNCMLPILTNLVMAIPFLIMGNLLLESFFGIPGLGDLLIGSINTRDIPVISALTFLTAVIYVFGVLITDLLYAVFDPRVRLQ
jgi:peptide/nickel transport system permease protein